MNDEERQIGILNHIDYEVLIDYVAIELNQQQWFILLKKREAAQH